MKWSRLRIWWSQGLQRADSLLFSTSTPIAYFLLSNNHPHYRTTSYALSSRISGSGLWTVSQQFQGVLTRKTTRSTRWERFKLVSLLNAHRLLTVYEKKSGSRCRPSSLNVSSTTPRWPMSNSPTTRNQCRLCRLGMSLRFWMDWRRLYFLAHVPLHRENYVCLFWTKQFCDDDLHTT